MLFRSPTDGVYLGVHTTVGQFPADRGRRGKKPPRLRSMGRAKISLEVVPMRSLTVRVTLLLLLTASVAGLFLPNRSTILAGIETEGGSCTDPDGGRVASCRNVPIDLTRALQVGISRSLVVVPL